MWRGLACFKEEQKLIHSSQAQGGLQHRKGQWDATILPCFLTEEPGLKGNMTLAEATFLELPSQPCEKDFLSS